MSVSSRQSAAVAIGGSISMAIGIGISRFVYTPILPFMESGLELSKSEAGLIASANFLGYLLGALIATKGGLPGSNRTWFVCSLVFCAVSTMAMAWITSLHLILGLRLMAGVTGAFVMVFSSAIILDRLSLAGRPGLSSVHFAGVGAGISISSVLVAVLVALEGGWQSMWIWSGVLSLILLVPVLVLVPKETKSPPPLKKIPGAGINFPLIALAVSFGLIGFGYVITATFISSLVNEIPGLQSADTLVWLVVGLSAIPSVAFWTWLGKYIGGGNSYAAASLVLAVGVAGSVLGEGLFSLILCGMMLGATFMGLTALGLINAREMSTGDPRQAIALMTASFGLGQMIGPTVAGYAFEIYGSFLIPSLVASGGLIIAALLVTLFKAPATSHQL